MKKAVIVSAQFLVELPEDIDMRVASDWGCDWLSNLSLEDVLDYRDPKIAGIRIRPSPVYITDLYSDDIFNENNLIQL